MNSCGYFSSSKTPEAVYEKLARDLLSRGRVEEAQQIEQKRKAAFIDEDN